MLTMKRELLIALSDIEALSIECGTCHSQIRVTNAAPIKMTFSKVAPMEHCPACQSEFGEAFKERLIALRTALATLAGTTPVVSLQIKTDALSSQQ